MTAHPESAKYRFEQAGYRLTKPAHFHPHTQRRILVSPAGEEINVDSCEHLCELADQLLENKNG